MSGERDRQRTRFECLWARGSEACDNTIVLDATVQSIRFERGEEPKGIETKSDTTTWALAQDKHGNSDGILDTS